MLIEGIDWKTVAALIGLVSNVAFIPYIWDIFKRRTEPHIYTWLIWLLTQGTAVAGIIHGEGGIAVLGLAFGTLLVASICLLSLKYGTKNITRSDTLILLAAGAAIFVWWQLDQPVLAVLIVTVVDALGYIPTFRKSYAEPWSETITSWLIFSLGNIASLLALDTYNLLTVPYVAMIAVANMLLTIFLLIRRQKVPKPL